MFNIFAHTDGLVYYTKGTLGSLLMLNKYCIVTFEDALGLWQCEVELMTYQSQQIPYEVVSTIEP